MANADIAKGLIAIKHKNGAPYNGSVKPYFVPSTFGTALFIGDPVVKTGTSNTVAIGDNNTQYAAGTLPEINKITFGATNPITGFIVAFQADPDTNLARTFNPANTQRVAFVADNPDIAIEIQDDASATLDATTVGLNANLVDGTGSTVTGFSGVELDATAPAADATFQLLIQRLVNRTDNELGDNAKWEVRINPDLHTEARALGV